MILVWSFYWWLFATAAALGGIAGWRAFGPLRIKGVHSPADAPMLQQLRVRHRNRVLAAAIIATILLAAAMHAGVGQGERFAARVGHDARAVLIHYEMQAVDARLARAPLRRELVLSGTADNFQRRELIRMFTHLDGVQAARWTAPGTEKSILRFPLPLLVETALLALASLGIGLTVAYIFELRRRARRDERYRGETRG